MSGLWNDRNRADNQHDALGNGSARGHWLSAPGVQLKLIPVSDTYEARVKGPNVTPGYLGRADLTEKAFDEEGFYRIGDTVSFLDPEKPELGLRFTGRISENFKLANGTWVAIGTDAVPPSWPQARRIAGHCRCGRKP